jgi:hypothetical protein
MNTRTPDTLLVDDFVRFMNDETFWTNDIYFDDHDEEYHEKHIAWDSGTRKCTARFPGTVLEWAHLDAELGWQGRGDRPEEIPDHLREFYERWEKQQRVTTVVLEVEKAWLSYTLASIANFKGVKVVDQK